MIDFKKEILEKREKNNKKVELYNSVINEYLPQIKDILEYNNLRVECYEKEEGLLRIDVCSSDEKTKYHFSYNDIKKCLYINPVDDLINKGMIENKLKDFVLRIAEREDIKIKETPVRGLRAKTGVIDEACDMNKEELKEVLNKYDKENNIYLSKKERNVIRTQIENVLSKFERIVDDHLCKNELELAKADHNVVQVARSILSKFDVADCEEPYTYDYYLTMDLSRDGDNKAILFKRYENSLKIEKFISFYEKDCTNMVRKFLEEMKGLNCAILIPTVAFGGIIVDYFKAEGFEDIIEVSPRDMYKAMCSNDLYIGKNCDESYIRSLFYTTSKLGFKL